MRKDRLVGEVLGEELALSPSDLYNAQFKSAVMGGYDKKEVDTFLSRAADVFEALLNQARELKEELEQQREHIQSAREMESTLRNALANAQKFSEDTLDAARREADAIREQARVGLERAKLEAHNLPAKLRQEIALLSQEREQLRQDIGAVLRTHYALLRNVKKAEDVVQGAASEEEPWDAEEDSSENDE